MNPPPPPPEFYGQPSPPKKELNLQGPRPSPLKVSKDSHKIRKPPPVPRQPTSSLPLPPPTTADQQLRQEPVIIYTVSPKVIHATVTDFMSVVQRLTGAASSSTSTSGAGDLSPAARLASIEKTSPSDRERERSGGGEGLMGMVEQELQGVEVGQFPGILSPAPGSLPAIPSGYFSPGWDPQSLFFTQDLSPFFNNNNNNNFMGMGMASPLVSPSPSSLDIFNLFDF